LITNGINTTGRELERFTLDLVINAWCFEESIPVYFAAAFLFRKKGDLEGRSECVGDAGFGGWRTGVNESKIKLDVT